MSLSARVAQIIADIRAHGDVAKWCQELDRYTGPLDISNASGQISVDLEQALLRNMQRIEAFHTPQLPSAYEVETAPGVRAGRRPVPLDAVACYVPGGRAAYPSTVLMTVTLARLAGVPRIVVATPVGPDGPHPAVVAAARMAGATQILAIGGAHGIAALAYGANGVEPVQCIVGPGNAYVTEAKRQVAADVRIDMLAGPSELTVLSDGQQLDVVARDMVAQAEHDPDARVVAYCPDPAALEAALAAVDAGGRAEIVAASLAHARIEALDTTQAIQRINAEAPEHVGIYHADGEQLASQIAAAGSVFVHTPVPFGDYATGTNHVLPTGGTAKLRGGLEVADFVRWITYQITTPEGRDALAPDMQAVAMAEGLENHARVHP